MKFLALASALSIDLVPAAIASSITRFDWLALSVTTAGGAHLEGQADGQGNILALSVAKDGWTCIVDKETLGKIAGAGLNDISVGEEPHFSYALIGIKAADFDPTTGNALNDIEWRLRCRDGKLVDVTKNVHELRR